MHHCLIIVVHLLFLLGCSARDLTPYPGAVLGGHALQRQGPSALSLGSHEHGWFLNAAVQAKICTSL